MNSVLFVAFFISNSLRVLFYLPQFFKFFKEENTLPSHSLFMWISWIVANLTVGIYFTIEVGLDEKAILSYMNSVMCIFGSGVIIYKRKKYKEPSNKNDGDGPRPGEEIPDPVGFELATRKHP